MAKKKSHELQFLKQERKIKLALDFWIQIQLGYLAEDPSMGAWLLYNTQKLRRCKHDVYPIQPNQ